MKQHAATLFWSGILAVAVLALVGGFLSGRSSAQRIGAMPVAMQLSSDVPEPLSRSLVGARGRDSKLEPFEPPIEEAVADRPGGWAPTGAPPQGDPVRLAIVICGIGIDDTLDRRFAEIPYPLTMAVPATGGVPALVSGQHANASALVVDADGATSVDEIAARLSAIHAGGVITPLAGHPRSAADLVRRMRELHAFVIDGMASDASPYYRTAREEHVAAASRDIVLDAHEGGGYTTYMLRQAIKLARRTGVAIAVAHATPETFDTLRSSLPGLLAQDDVIIVPVGQLVR
jgi:hypothetical protein